MSILMALLGVLIFSVGGLLATRYWEGLSQTPRKKSTIYPLIFALFLLLVGAFLSTYFWNNYFYERGFAKSKEAITYILAAEIMVNRSILQDRKFQEPIDSNLNKFVVFPKFQITALQAALTSGAFVHNKDIDLFTAIFNLNEILTDANSRIDLTERQILVDKRPENIMMWRKGVRNGETMKSIKQLLNDISKILISRYGIKQESTFFNKSNVYNLSDSS